LHFPRRFLPPLNPAAHFILPSRHRQIHRRRKVWSHDLAMPGDEPQPWMAELAKMLILKDLPTGVIVGTSSIMQFVKGDSFYECHLTDVERVKKHRKPNGHPQPVWFTPF
jgi:hypothetical protein